MKKFLCILMICLLTVSCVSVMAEEEENILAAVEGKTFYFSSGVGGWFTELNVGEDGAFTGQFHDSEMGELADAYPNGTVYGCLFHGKFAAPKYESEGMWTLQVEELALDEGQVPESIEDGIRYVTSEAPYGLEKAKQVTLYLPGTPVDSLPEGFLPWSHLQEIDAHAESLPYYAIWSEADEAGFVGDVITEEATEQVGIANPWREVSKDELMKITGLSFALPEGAENVLYLVMNNGELSEMQFDCQNVHYNARIAEADAFTDISGMYYTWDGVSAFSLGDAFGACWKARDEEGHVYLSLWYDMASGLMYSLTAEAQGEVDMPAMAQAVYVPMQAE